MGGTKRRATSALTEDAPGSVSRVSPSSSSSDKPSDAEPWVLAGCGVGMFARRTRCRWCDVLVKRRRERQWLLSVIDIYGCIDGGILPLPLIVTLTTCRRPGHEEVENRLRRTVSHFSGVGKGPSDEGVARCRNVHDAHPILHR